LNKFEDGSVNGYEKLEAAIKDMSEEMQVKMADQYGSRTPKLTMKNVNFLEANVAPSDNGGGQILELRFEEHYVSATDLPEFVLEVECPSWIVYRNAIKKLEIDEQKYLESVALHTERQENRAKMLAESKANLADATNTLKEAEETMMNAQGEAHKSGKAIAEQELKIATTNVKSVERQIQENVKQQEYTKRTERKLNTKLNENSEDLKRWALNLITNRCAMANARKLMGVLSLDNASIDDCKGMGDKDKEEYTRSMEAITAFTTKFDKSNHEYTAKALLVLLSREHDLFEIGYHRKTVMKKVVDAVKEFHEGIGAEESDTFDSMHRLIKAAKNCLEEPTLQTVKAAMDKLTREQMKCEAGIIMDTEMAKYLLIWERVYRESTQELKELQEVAKKIEEQIEKSGVRNKQPDYGMDTISNAEYLTTLKVAFESIDNALFKDVKQIAQAYNVTFKPGKPKKDSRAVDKVLRAYKGDYACLKDLRRASIICPDVSTMVKLLRHLQTSGLKISRVKNRFRSDYDVFRTCGYRDLQLNVVGQNGLIWELQLHLKNIEEIKSDEGHKRYVTFRSIFERLVM